MALKATIYKVSLQISDMDRQYYQDHSFTLAKHPSETEERLLLRLIAFCLKASERLVFCKGLSEDDEPDLWEKSYSDDILQWVELGWPDEKKLKKACDQSEQVTVIAYNTAMAKPWWGKVEAKANKFKNLSVIHIVSEESALLLDLLSRGMNLQCTMDGGQMWLSSEDHTIEVNPEVWK